MRNHSRIGICSSTDYCVISDFRDNLCSMLEGVYQRVLQLFNSDSENREQIPATDFSDLTAWYRFLDRTFLICRFWSFKQALASPGT